MSYLGVASQRVRTVGRDLLHYAMDLAAVQLARAYVQMVADGIWHRDEKQEADGGMRDSQRQGRAALAGQAKACPTSHPCGASRVLLLCIRGTSET